MGKKNKATRLWLYNIQTKRNCYIPEAAQKYIAVVIPVLSPG